MYALILGGGSGTRLWPRSRQRTPKQLLNIAAEESMLQATFDRLRPLMPPENVYIITNEACAPEIRRQLPLVPAANTLAEPAGRNTAPAIGLGSLYIRRRDPEAVVATVSADHLIRDKDEFVAVMNTAAGLARQGHLVTVGIKPSRPDTGYGYIELGRGIESADGQPAYEVARFREKPDLETAKQFLAGGKHLWNAGMFVWRVDAVLDAIGEHLPDLHQALTEIDDAIGTDHEAAVLESVWSGVDSVSIDYGVLEKAGNVAVVPADLGWSDIGTWASLAEVLPADAEGNVVLGCEHLGLGTAGTLVSGSRRLIATIGLQDVIVIDTEDVVLVCAKERAQDVKDLVDKLKAQKRSQYL